MSGTAADRAQRRLLRALAPALTPFTLVAARTIDWASATFEGAQHRLALRLEGPDASARATALAASLPDRQFAIPGALVADLSAVAHIDAATGAATIAIEVLLLDEEPCAGFSPPRGGRRGG